jgi:hypothetical protein
MAKQLPNQAPVSAEARKPIDPDARTGNEPRSSRNTMVSDPGDVHDSDPSTLTTPAGVDTGAKAKDGLLGRALTVPPMAPDAPTLDAYPDRGEGTLEICLDGGGTGNGAAYRVGKPIPQDIVLGSDIYNLSDREKGIYTYRVK